MNRAQKLISCKTQLANKIDILSDFDDKISNLLPGEKIEDDIIQSSDYRGDMQATITQIDVTLAKSEKPSFKFKSSDCSAKLPKLSLKKLLAEIRWNTSPSGIV